MSRTLRVVLAASSAAAVALLFGACSALVGSGGEDPLRCELGPMGEDPCPGDTSCIDGFCQSTECQPQTEICGNGIDDDCDGGTDERTDEVDEACDGGDNDCDGRIDEGLDEDGDGFTWCPLAPAPEIFDCLDSDPDVHPPDPDTGLPDEECDGIDNDCDGLIDEPRSGDIPLCERGQGCFPALGGCQFIDCRLDEVICPDRHACNESTVPAVCELVTFNCELDGCAMTPGSVCDPDTLQCVVPGPTGAGCRSDIGCLSGQCETAASLGLDAADLGGASGVCTTPCCTNADCSGTDVCWTPGTGASGCLPPALLDMSSFGAPQQGLCRGNIDCSGSECTLRQEDAYEQSGRFALACGAGPGAGTGSCTENSQCQSGACIASCGPIVAFPPVGCSRRCADACRTASDCRSDEGCIYYSINSMWAAPGCAFTGESFLTSERGGCSDDDDCRDAGCIGGNCRPTCCSNLQCNANERCRPQLRNGRYEMRCLSN